MSATKVFEEDWGQLFVPRKNCDKQPFGQSCPLPFYTLKIFPSASSLFQEGGKGLKIYIFSTPDARRDVLPRSPVVTKYLKGYSLDF